MAEFPAWNLHASAWAIMAALEGAYLWTIRRRGPQHVQAGEPAATRGQVIAFSSGVAVMLVAGVWPIHDLSERALFSVHMFQHLLIAMIAPPLLIRGMPDWMLRRLLRPVMPVARMVLRPVVAFFVFNTLLIATHWPPLVTASVQNEALHFSLHAILLLSGLIMWWPVLSPLAELPRLAPPGQMLYLFLQSILPTVPASFLTFGSSPLYHVYTTFPRLWGISPVIDQRIAGLLMKLGGGAILWTAVAIVWFKWSHREETGTPGPGEWQHVEREINRIGSRKP